MDDTPQDQQDKLEALMKALRAEQAVRTSSTSDIFQRRAAQYAAVPGDDRQSDTDSLTLLTFYLNDERYGLEAVYVQSVRPLPAVTRVPNAPSFYVGVVNVRGAVITLLDLADFLGFGRAVNPAELIIVRVGDLRLGLPVTRVTDVLNLPRSQIRSLDDASYTLGVATTPTDALIVLSIQDLFDDNRLLAREEVPDDAI